MFAAESNAKAQAKIEQARLEGLGWTEANAKSWADQQAAEKIQEANKWITENVGLD
jgi:hypothetical protein